MAGLGGLTLLWLGVGLCSPALAGAAKARATVVRQVRTWTAPDHTRIVLDLSGPAAYEVRRVTDPDRIAVNVAGARFASTSALTVGDGVVAQVRRNALRGRAQLVIDLGGAGEIRHFRLPAANGRPHRIVVDVFRPVVGAAPPVGSGASVTVDTASTGLVTGGGRGGRGSGARFGWSAGGGRHAGPGRGES